MENIQKIKEKRVQKIIAQAFRVEEKTKQQTINFSLKNIFEAHGDSITALLSPDLVEIITNELFELKKEGKIPVKRSPTLKMLIWIISDFASRQHVTRLTEMLLWDEICLLRGVDRLIRSWFLQALKRLGNANSLPSLRDYKKRVKETKYSDYAFDLFVDGRLQPPYSLEKIRQLDQREIDEVIKSCQQRPAK